MTLFLVLALASNNTAAGEDVVTLPPEVAVTAIAVVDPIPPVLQQDGTHQPEVLTLEEQIVLALSKVCVSEANWTHLNDCPAIHQVLRRRMHFRGDPNLLVTAQAYCPHATGAVPPETVRQRWIANLRLDGQEPRGWRRLNTLRRRQHMRPLNWERSYLHRWEARIAETVNLLANPRRVCRGVVDHWGARWWDRSHLGWRRVNCGRTIEAFWRIPR